MRIHVVTRSLSTTADRVIWRSGPTRAPYDLGRDKPRRHTRGVFPGSGVLRGGPPPGRRLPGSQRAGAGLPRWPLTTWRNDHAVMRPGLTLVKDTRRIQPLR